MKVELSLPENFRVRDLLAYHGRDPQSRSEIVAGPDLQSGVAQIFKGLEWNGQCACLSLRVGRGRVQASLEHCAPAQLTMLVEQMLGLKQPVEEFERAFQHHPDLGTWVQKNTGLRLPQAASPFEALAWAICGQQISVSAALSIRRRWLQRLGLRHASGLLCHPEPGRVVELSLEELRDCGFSRGKARALAALSQALNNGLSLRPDKFLPERLLDLPGIGPWTVHYALLRGFGQMDACLHGDAAVLRALKRLTGRSQIAPAWAQGWLEEFKPFRGLAVAHLWACLSENQP